MVRAPHAASTHHGDHGTGYGDHGLRVRDVRPTGPLERGQMLTRGAPFAARVETIVRRIPKSSVATYGQVAALAGAPRAARMVGWVLRFSHRSVPWQRVVNREGRLSIIHEHFTAATQAALLGNEGVKVRQHDGAYWVDLEKFLWHPRGRAGIV